MQRFDHKLFLGKRHFCQILSKISENCDHYIDPFIWLEFSESPFTIYGGILLISITNERCVCTRFIKATQGTNTYGFAEKQILLYMPYIYSEKKF
jgi:hypothetical protein